MDDRNDGLQKIIDEALESMAAECAGDFDPQACNLAEFCRRTGMSRQRARTIKANGFKVKPHGRIGLRVVHTVLSGYTGTIDDLLRKGTRNSQVIFERLVAQGYGGGLTTVKTYVAALNSNSDHVVGEEAAGAQLRDPERQRADARDEPAFPVAVPAVSRGPAELVRLSAHDFVHDALGELPEQLLHVHEAVLEAWDGKRRFRRRHVCHAVHRGHCLSLEPVLW